MTRYTEQERNWVLNEIRRETSCKNDPKKQTVVMWGISPKELEHRATDGRKPHGNATGIPSRDKVRAIIRDLTNEGRIKYIRSGGRKHSILVELKLDQRMQNDRTFLYATYLRLLGEIDKMVKKALIRAFKEKDFFEYVRIKNELSAFPLQVYYSDLNASDRVKSELASDLLDNIKEKILQLKRVEKIQRKQYSNFDRIINAIEQLQKFHYELYCLFDMGKKEKTRKQVEITIRSRRNEIELLIKEGKINPAN